MCQRRNGLITAQTKARFDRGWGNSPGRLGESWRRWIVASGSPNERVAGTLVAEISRHTTKDEAIDISSLFQQPGKELYGNRGLYAVAALSGLTDAAT